MLTMPSGSLKSPFCIQGFVNSNLEVAVFFKYANYVATSLQMVVAERYATAICPTEFWMMTSAARDLVTFRKFRIEEKHFAQYNNWFFLRFKVVRISFNKRKFFLRNAFLNVGFWPFRNCIFVAVDDTLETCILDF